MVSQPKSSHLFSFFCPTGDKYDQSLLATHLTYKVKTLFEYRCTRTLLDIMILKTGCEFQEHLHISSRELAAQQDFNLQSSNAEFQVTFWQDSLKLL